VVKAAHLQEPEIELPQQHVRTCLGRVAGDTQPHVGKTLVHFDVVAVDG
jgi:hypothetical protein